MSLCYLHAYEWGVASQRLAENKTALSKIPYPLFISPHFVYNGQLEYLTYICNPYRHTSCVEQAGCGSVQTRQIEIDH